MPTGAEILAGVKSSGRSGPSQRGEIAAMTAEASLKAKVPAITVRVDFLINVFAGLSWRLRASSGTAADEGPLAGKWRRHSRQDYSNPIAHIMKGA